MLQWDIVESSLHACTPNQHQINQIITEMDDSGDWSKAEPARVYTAIVSQ